MGVESLLRARLPGPQEELKSASSEGTQPRFSPLGTCQRRRQCCSSTTGWWHQPGAPPVVVLPGSGSGGRRDSKDTLHCSAKEVQNGAKAGGRGVGGGGGSGGTGRKKKCVQKNETDEEQGRAQGTLGHGAPRGSAMSFSMSSRERPFVSGTRR